MDEASLERLRADLEDDTEDGVLPVNATIVAAFLAVQTQWRALAVPGGLGAGRVVALGLDYAGVRAGLEAMGIAIDGELWAGLMVMEQAAAAAMNK